jgi:dihydroorotate dehydrogenase
MPLVPYGVLRPFLFQMDPEAAHDLALRLIERTQHNILRYAYAQSRVDDPLTLAGLRLPNRVGLAAGLDKNARCIAGWDAMGFGFVEVGTVTPKAQPGNPRPRIFRLPKARGLINRLGFNNEGLDAFLRNVQQAKFRDHGHASPMLLGLNIGKNGATPMQRAAEDYLIGLDGVYPFADYVAVNISSPNTKNLRELQSDEALDALIGTLSERRSELSHLHNKHVPLFIKIAPDLDEHQIEVIANTLKRHCANESNPSWGVIATNTTLSREAVQGLAYGDENGGLSGVPVFEKSNAVIRQLRSALGPQFPIMGVGGIFSGADAVAKIKAGADVVQIYSGLIYQGPSLIQQAAQAIREHS